MSRNVTHALIHVLRRIEDEGRIVVARGQEQKEVLSTLTKIARPAERFMVLPGRHNNVFAQVAETAWVLAGRDDLDFLGHYLPRAVQFSDDGLTWRAAYGPRLREWGGRVDQVAEVDARLREDPHTKRAVLSIYDPGSDFQDTKDVPCNNWLQLVQRDGVLDMHVTVRANDAIWGFSGINVFEWSVLHELLAASRGWQVGALSWYVGSFHVYERHYATARRLATSRHVRSPYEFGVPQTPVMCSVADVDGQLASLFESEGLARSGDHAASARVGEEVSDPYLHATAVMLRAYNAELQGASRTTVLDVVAELGQSDCYVAALEHLARRWKDESVLDGHGGPVGAFLEHHLSERRALQGAGV